ncbi:ABC transporter ATP-binding protein [Pyrococcus kukulkanii]
MAEVKLVNVWKVFGGFVAVRDLSLEVGDGEFLVLLGPSGCGKTTTLRMIAGLEEPSRGRIIIGDKVVADAERGVFVPPKERDVAMVFQSYALYPHMSVYDNIAFPLKLRKLPKQEIDKRVREVAEMLGLTELLNRKPRELSGGQRQRVALGRAIVRRPKVFLMDEPLSNLDAKLRVKMRAELKKLQRQLGVTTIYVTHDQVEAMTMGDRIAVMNKGILQQVGTPEEVYEKPKNTFVAGFIGTPPMNFTEGTFDGTVFEAGEFKIELPKEYREILKDLVGKSLILGFRPEDVIVGEGDLRGIVEIIENLGSERILHIKIGNVTIKAKTNKNIKEGEKIKFKINMQKVHIFNKQTTEAII